ncbi:MAG: HAD family phosphatase [Lachnospiraceae bacterium]|nr:HAD family phosphatase [Lachnospiraceae bacterium]
MIKNVIFDVGGVLIDWNVKRALETFGFSTETIHKIESKIFLPEVWVEEDLSIKGENELLSFFQSKCPECAEDFAYLWDHFDQTVSGIPGTDEWIKSLQEQGKHVYILSNFGTHCFKQVRKKFLGFLDIVDGAVISYEIHKVKPEREIYDYLLDKYDLKAEESVFIDDREENLLTARKLGLHTILCKDRTQTKHDLEEILK